MDLRNNQITIGEILVYPRGAAILNRNFPEMMNPFLLVVAKKMTLENILKLAQGPNAQNQVESIMSDLTALQKVSHRGE
jgi:hypothetical protein